MFKKIDSTYNAREARTKTSAPGLTSIMRNADPNTIGPSIHIKGEIRGNEDLVVHGYIEGTIDIGEGFLRVTREGRIEADVVARVINIEGRAVGDLRASEQIIVRKTGQVRGKIAAPRVGLDFGCKFSGSIDSDVKEKSNNSGASAVKEQNVVEFEAAKSGARKDPSRSTPGKIPPR